MEDLSHLLKPDPITAMTPTSSAGGHVPRSNEYAMTAPGSPPAADTQTFETVTAPAPPVKVDTSSPVADRNDVTDKSGRK